MLDWLIELIPPSVYIAVALGVIVGIAVRKWDKKRVSVLIRTVMRVTSDLQELTPDNVDTYLGIIERWCKEWLTKNDYMAIKTQLRCLGELRSRKK